MRASRDTFTHFLADNLGGKADVHLVLKNPNDPSAERIVVNAVNLTFRGDRPDAVLSSLSVDIDIVYDSELTAIDVTQEVWNILSSAFYTPKLDYSGETVVPVSPPTNLTWKRHSLDFKTVYDPLCFRKSCTLTLEHHL